MSSSVINRLNQSEAGFNDRLQALLAWESVSDTGVQARVTEIVHAVRDRGDQALVDYTQQFDGLSIASADELVVPASRLQQALAAIDSEQRAALQTAADRVRRYHEKQKQDSWQYQEADGVHFQCQLVNPGTEPDTLDQTTNSQV